MISDIRYGNNARRRMLAGANLLADAVQVTLGARGRNVVIEHRTTGFPPVVTKDGVTVARSIEVADRFQSAGVGMFSQMAGIVAKQCGDGTTTSIVLARAIANNLLKAMAGGLDPKGLRIGMELAVTAAIEDLRRRARSCVDRRSLVLIAATASNGEVAIGDLLATAFAEVGNRGLIHLKPGNGVSDEIEFLEGARWEQGWLSPYFVTEKIRRHAELTSPYVLLYDRVIHRFEELIPVLEQVREVNGELLIVAESVEDAALTGILLNHIRCVLKAVAVKPPGFGDHRAETLGDLACLTGGRAILEANGDDLCKVKLVDLGRARSVVVGEEFTSVIGGGGAPRCIEARLEGLRLQGDLIRNSDASKGSPTGKAHDLANLEERIGNLATVTATISVGGGSEVEIKERWQRIENARNAVSAALAEGVLPGAGVGLLRCRKALASLTSDDLDVRHGIAIITDALAEPLRLIGRNAGRDSDALIAAVLASDDEAWGLDVQSGAYGDLFELGIIDPLRVTRLALRHAVSTASTLMTTECVVAEVPPIDPSFGYTAEWAAATREDPRR